MDMGVSLVIMAAGIGSRFGGGIKQLEPVGPNGEIIMDYSIHDALEAGFQKVVFIIRKDLEKDFKEIIGKRIEKICDVSYAYQELDDLPDGFAKTEERTKPWGTGQAVLSCKDLVSEPFAVINADDYYGKEAYRKVYAYLSRLDNPEKAGKTNDYCMAGFILKNTLSDYGGVTRGLCTVDENQYLKEVKETQNIIKTDSGIAASPGAAVRTEEGLLQRINQDAYVSMNMWGLTPGFFAILEKGFADFLGEKGSSDLKAEYLLPTIIDRLLREEKARVKLLETNDKWFGVTYKADKETVAASFRQLIADGVYKENLFG